MNADKLLTQKEVAERLRISLRTLAKFRNEGKLSFWKFGHRTVRIRASELARFEKEAELAAVTRTLGQLLTPKRPVSPPPPTARGGRIIPRQHCLQGTCPFCGKFRTPAIHEPRCRSNPNRDPRLLGKRRERKSSSAVRGKSPAAEVKAGVAAGFSEDFPSPLPAEKEAQQ